MYCKSFQQNRFTLLHLGNPSSWLGLQLKPHASSRLTAPILCDGPGPALPSQMISEAVEGAWAIYILGLRP